MSKHEALVHEISLSQHPNAEKLSIVRLGGFQCVVNTEMWQGKTKAIYIMPDSVVDTTKPEFSFLDRGRGKERIKCVRLRGEFSQGLLIPAPESATIGQNFWDELGLEWYEPELHLATTGEFAAAPPKWGGLSKYDVENCRRTAVSSMFVENELVEVTSKLNGSNCSFVFTDGEMYVRSRSGFRRKEKDNLFWKALELNPNIEAFCRANPDTLLYGEVYGNNSSYRYDCKPNEVKFRVFDIMRSDRTFYNVTDRHDACINANLAHVPVVRLNFPFNIDKLLEIAEEPCQLGNKISEGIVIRPLMERRCGNERVIAKIVSNQYLLSGK